MAAPLGPPFVGKAPNHICGPAPFTRAGGAERQLQVLLVCQELKQASLATSGRAMVGRSDVFDQAPLKILTLTERELALLLRNKHLKHAYAGVVIVLPSNTIQKTQVATEEHSTASPVCGYNHASVAQV